MAEAVAVTAPAEPAAGRGRLTLVVGAVVVLLVVAMAAKTFLLAPAADPDAPQPAPVEGAVVEIGEMTTSLAGGGTHYAKVQLAAVLEEGTDATTVEGRYPLLRDEALGVLMSFTPEELRSVEGADRLREQLTERAATVWEDGEVLRIVLTELLVQ